MMSKVLRRLTARRSQLKQDICVWVGYSKDALQNPTIRCNDTITDANAQYLISIVELPKRRWYWSVKRYNTAKGPQVQLRRVATKLEPNLYPWPEVFEAWLAYARML
jgi:hypothetical protein